MAVVIRTAMAVVIPTATAVAIRMAYSGGGYGGDTGGWAIVVPGIGVVAIG